MGLKFGHDHGRRENQRRNRISEIGKRSFGVKKKIPKGKGKQLG